MVTKKFDEFGIFHQKIWQKCAIELKFSLNVLLR